MATARRQAEKREMSSARVTHEEEEGWPQVKMLVRDQHNTDDAPAGAMSFCNQPRRSLFPPAGWQKQKLESNPPTIDSQLVRVSTVGSSGEGRSPTAARRRVDVAWGEARLAPNSATRACAGRSFGRVRNPERSASALNGQHRRNATTHATPLHQSVGAQVPSNLTVLEGHIGVQCCEEKQTPTL
jgi:hypothetical protein